MSKQCMTLISCQFSKHCKHANVPHAQANGFFQPQSVGEHCHHYELLPVEIDMHKQVMAAMHQRGFLSLSMAPWIVASVCATLAFLFFNLYRSTSDEYAQYKAAVSTAQENAKRESDKVTADVSLAWASALDHYRKHPNTIRVQSPCGQVPVPGTPARVNATPAPVTITAEQCEGFLNAGIKDADQLRHLQRWVKAVGEIE